MEGLKVFEEKTGSYSLCVNTCELLHGRCLATEGKQPKITRKRQTCRLEAGR